MQAKERLYLTKDGKALVREGDPKGVSLYAAPGDEIPASAAERFGLVDGTIKAKGAGSSSAPAATPPKAPKAPKAAKGGQKKEAPPAPNKEQALGEDKGPAAPSQDPPAQEQPPAETKAD